MTYLDQWFALIANRKWYKRRCNFLNFYSPVFTLSSQSSGSKMWFVDLTFYRIDTFNFPTEIAVLNRQTLACTVYHINYPCNYFNNFKDRIVYHGHPLNFMSDDETLYSVIHQLTSLVGKTDVILVDSNEKQKFLSRWFNNVYESQNVGLDSNYPSSQDEMCKRHLERYDSPCARQNVYRMLGAFNKTTAQPPYKYWEHSQSTDPNWKLMPITWMLCI